jgi:hypothetical protein
MGEVMDKVADALGIEERRHELSRIDMKWYRNQRLAVAIEHENTFNKRSIMRTEFQKLLDAEASLRVLITYMPETQFRIEQEKPQQGFGEEIGKEIAKKLPLEKNAEFLLLLASYEWAKVPQEEKWIADVWKPEISHARRAV